jgi:hypothetical protein
MKENEKVRQAIKESGFYQWEIAAKVGVSEPTFIRRLRFPLQPDREREILEAIAELKKGNTGISSEGAR